MQVKITFVEPLLGTVSGNKEIAEEFIISKHPDGHCQEESDAIALNESLEKSSTVFARTPDGEAMLWNYLVKGFCKEACAAMIHNGGITQEELKKARLTEYLYKKTIDETVFVFPRRIVLQLPPGTQISWLERPLRGQTMRGERVALARSEVAPQGTTIETEIKLLNPKLEPYLATWLNYGFLKGLGQWRNASWGSFTWIRLDAP